MSKFHIYAPARYIGVFLIIVAVLWIPLLFAAIWSIFNSHRYFGLFCFVGIGGPLLIAAYCLFARLHFRRSFDRGVNMLFYAYLGIPICTFLSISLLVILLSMNQIIAPFLIQVITPFLADPVPTRNFLSSLDGKMFTPVGLLGVLAGYVAVLQCFLCSILECRQTLEKDQPSQQYPLLAWAALLLSIDALLLIAFFTFVIRQLLLM